MKIRAAIAALLCIFAPAAVFAQQGTIDLNAFPSIGVADGRSQYTITAVVRERNGSFVADGTQVIFDTNLGTFRENVVTTENGYARAELVASSIAGIARIRASAIRLNAANTLEFEFVSDPSVLDSAKDFIEITAPENLVYSMDDRALAASDPEGRVVVRYRDIVVRAEDVQVRIPTYQLKARNATLIFGDVEQEFSELYLALNRRKGFGIAEYEGDVYRMIESGLLVTAVKEKRMRYGPVGVTSEGLTPDPADFDQRQLKMLDMGDSISTVEAKKAIAYPRKEVLFYQSNVKVQGLSVMKVPLFKVNSQTSSPLITEQFVNVSGNQLAVNYPYYLDLKPGQSSLLRLRYGQRYGQSVGAGGGMFLDYELNWNKGDEMQGGLAFQGLARDDWGAQIRQYMRPDPTLTLTAQLDFPAHRSMYGVIGANKIFDGFSVNMNGQYGQSLVGDRYQQDGYSMTAELDPIKVPALNSRMYLGVDARASNFRGESSSNSLQTLGAQARFVSNPFRINRDNTIRTSYKFGHRTGTGISQPFTQQASLIFTSNVSNNLLLQGSYDFIDDGFNSQFLGRHQATAEAFFNQNNFSVRGYLSRSLDIERMNASATLDYQFSPLWRFYYSYYHDTYLGDAFSDQTFILGYRLGFREIGISYSARRNRLGLELLGTRF